MSLRFYKVSANSDKECLVTFAEFLATRQHVKKLGPIAHTGSFCDFQAVHVQFSRPKENSHCVIIYCCTVNHPELSGCKQPPIIPHLAVGRGADRGQMCGRSPVGTVLHLQSAGGSAELGCSRVAMVPDGQAGCWQG